MIKILSQETIKPSSPTPPHLKTHILSLVDYYTPPSPIPFIFFYKHYNNGDIHILKKSLSQCLTQYYPFAGRITPSDAHIECNDQGVEFLEASHNSRLEDFILNKENDKSLYQLLPNVGNNCPNLVEVQLTRFTDGGVAVAVSISHKVADGFALVTFVNQWAKVTRGGSSFKPNFFTSCTNHNNVKLPEVVANSTRKVKYVKRSFVFPNSKLNELKKKVMSMGIDVAGPVLTRVEVLTSLIFKCSVDAATTKSGFFKPSILVHPVNMRNKIINNDPEKAVGNILAMAVERTIDPREIALNEVVAKLRKGKMETKEIRDVQEIGEKYATIFPPLVGDRSSEIFWTTSFCWFPLYEVDFGWGPPVQVKYAVPKMDNKHLFLMDTPYRDGIEATVRLPEEEMLIFQNNKELLAYIDG